MYKNTKIKPFSPFFKPESDAFPFDEDTISKIQSVFQNMLDLDPKNLNDNTQYIFSDLEKIVDSEKCCYNLPTIVSFSIYPKLVEFLSTCDNSFYHLIISRLITSLTSSEDDTVTEFYKNDIFTVLCNLLYTYKFPESTPYLFQILANYLSDSNKKMSNFAHETFSISSLYKIIQYIKSFNNTKTDLMKSILNRWMKCVFCTISKYTKDIKPSDATICLIEISSYFDLVIEDPLLCKSLCYSITTLIDNDLLVYADFNNFGYQQFLWTMSHLDSDCEVKSYSIVVIGKLISVNKLMIVFDLREYFNELLLIHNSNGKVLSAIIYLCNCCLRNQIIYRNSFEIITQEMTHLFELYDRALVTVRIALIDLFASFIIAFSVLKNIDDFKSFESIVFRITKIFFEFIDLSDDIDVILCIIESIFILNAYLFDKKLFNLPAIQKYIVELINCMNKLKKFEDHKIVEFAEKILSSLNKNQNETN